MGKGTIGGGGNGLTKMTRNKFRRRHAKMLNQILAANTGQDESTVEKDTDRDNIMTPEQAKAYGLIDQVVIKRPNETELNK